MKYTFWTISVLFSQCQWTIYSVVSKTAIVLCFKQIHVQCINLWKRSGKRHQHKNLYDTDTLVLVHIFLGYYGNHLCLFSKFFKNISMGAWPYLDLFFRFWNLNCSNAKCILVLLQFIRSNFDINNQ